MASSTRYLTFEGQFESKVLGTFRIIRGFANLKDLAEISVPYEMEDGNKGGVVNGQQRKLDKSHAEHIKHYLESGEQRFLPEVILSVRHDLFEELDENSIPIGVGTGGDEEGIKIGRRWKGQGMRVHRITVDREKLTEIRAQRLIRRVDGNHRLALAETLTDDPALTTKYLAPFCLVLLGDINNEADDYSESLIFHTINSTALPLESEHALKLILGQNPDYDMTPENEFAYSPGLHLTRLLRDGLLGLPRPIQKRLGSRPLTSLSSAVHGLLDMAPEIAADLPTLTRYSENFLAALNDIVTRLGATQSQLSKADFFIELAARVWKATPEGNDHDSRVDTTVKRLEQLAVWLGKDGLVDLKEGLSLSKQILDIHTAVSARIPKKVFLARWYPPKTAPNNAHKKATFRLQQLQQTLTNIQSSHGISLELIDLGTEEGGTFPIHTKMYDAIESADIIICDLTGQRPNVYIEAGYALKHHEKNRLIFIFEAENAEDKVPFDLNTFKYVEITQAAEIPNKIGTEITAILRESGIPI